MMNPLLFFSLKRIKLSLVKVVLSKNPFLIIEKNYGWRFVRYYYTLLCHALFKFLPSLSIASLKKLFSETARRCKDGGVASSLSLRFASFPTNAKPWLRDCSLRIQLLFSIDWTRVETCAVHRKGRLQLQAATRAARVYYGGRFGVWEFRFKFTTAGIYLLSSTTDVALTSALKAQEISLPIITFLSPSSPALNSPWTLFSCRMSKDEPTCWRSLARGLFSLYLEIILSPPPQYAVVLVGLSTQPRSPISSKPVGFFALPLGCFRLMHKREVCSCLTDDESCH